MHDFHPSIGLHWSSRSLERIFCNQKSTSFGPWLCNMPHTTALNPNTLSFFLPKNWRKNNTRKSLWKTSRVAIDWWTVGVFLFELMAGHPPFEPVTLECGDDGRQIHGNSIASNICTISNQTKLWVCLMDLGFRESGGTTLAPHNLGGFGWSEIPRLRECNDHEMRITTRWFWAFVYVQPYNSKGNDSNLTHVLQMRWNHQLIRLQKIT